MHRVKAVSIVLTALLLLLIASVVFAQYSPDVLIVDQDVVDGEVIVARATVNGPGWVVVYTDKDDEPGSIIGYAPLMNGINANIMVDLDPENVTEQLYAVLHEDLGFVGTFEYPGDDVPVMDDDGEMIVTPFQATGSGSTIAGVVSEAEGFGKLLAALQAADLADVLRGEGPFTVFAPTDEAFDAMPADELEALLRDTDALGNVLRNHVVAGEINVDELTDGFETETLGGNMLFVTVDGDKVLVNDAAITESNDGPVNGIIHAITSILMPQAAEEAAPEEEAEAPEAPSRISGRYQESDGSSVTVASVVAANDGWIAIRIDDSFTPGEVLGYAAVSAGEYEDLVVELEEALADNAMVWAVLHVDDGEIGVFEFPDGDEPMMYVDSVVMGPFNVVVTDMVEAVATEEEAAEETTETAPSTMAGVTETVGSFLQSFLTLDGDEEAAAAEAAAAEAAAAEAAAAEAAAAEAAAAEAAAAEAAAAEAAGAEAAAAEAAAAEKSGVAIDVTAAVHSLLGSVLNLNDDEAMAEEGEEAAEGDNEAMAGEGEEAAEGDDEAMAEEGEEAAEGDNEAMAGEGEEAAEGDDEAMIAEGDEAAEGANEAMAEEEAEAPVESPEDLPETGLNLASGGATLPVVALVMMVLFAGAFVTRRRPV